MCVVKGCAVRVTLSPPYGDVAQGVEQEPELRVASSSLAIVNFFREENDTSERRGHMRCRSTTGSVTDL